MNRITLAILLVSLLCCQPAGAAQLVYASSAETHSETNTLTQTLMIKSGLFEQIENTPETLKTAIEKGFQNAASSETLSDDVIDEIKSIISISFKPDIIRSIVSEHIQAKLESDDIVAVLAWLDSPLGKKFTHLEEMSTSPEAYQEMTSLIPTLQQAKDYDERIRLMYEIDKSINATELMMDRVLNMQIVTITAMASAFPSMKLPSVEMIKNRFETNRKEISQRISREITLSALYTYRDVSRDDLNKYIEFMNSDYGKRYHQVVYEGTSKAYTVCGKKFGDAVGKVISNKSRPAIKKTSVQYYPQEL